MTKRSREYFARKKALKDVAWMCSCGHYEESDMHCSICGNEPPWGCPGECCQSSGWDDYDDEDEWGDEEEDDIICYTCQTCGMDSKDSCECPNCGAYDMGACYF